MTLYEDITDELTSDQQAVFEEIFGLRGAVCAGILDKWVQEERQVPLSWDDIVYASWVLWPDEQSLLHVLLAEKEQDLEILHLCIQEELDHGEDALAAEGYSPALWLLVLEGRRVLEAVEASGILSG